jgi:prevent-host-death family protein
MSTVGIFEAKAKLSEIVRKAEQGERTTITVRGQAKAQIVPMPTAERQRSQEEIEAAYERMRNPRIKGISPEQIRRWIEEGRK